MGINTIYIAFGLLFIIAIAIISAIASKNKSKKQNEKEIKQAGNKGEKLFQQIEKNILNKNDILINNVELNVDGKKTEIDNLIINQNGIFIIEVKNYNGVLYGGIDDYEWTKEKTSPSGEVFVKQVKNPIKQVKRQTYILSKRLKSNGIHIWINGYVYFINHNSPIKDECVIYSINKLDKSIHSYANKTYDKQTILKAYKILKKGGR